MLNIKPSTILIIDGQPKNLKMLFGFLKEANFKILVAKQGERAIKKLQKVSPDLILLNETLPGMDGFETCQRLKTSTETKDIPVIFIASLSEPIDKIKGLKCGAIDYIDKPFEQNEVLARIENQIKIRNLQKQVEEQHQELQKATEALQQSQTLLAGVLKRNHALLDAIPDIMFRQRGDGTYLDIYAKEGRLFAPIKTFIGQNLSDIPLPEDVKQGLLKHLQAAIETGELQTYEYELPMSDGVHSEEARFVKSGGDEAIRIVRDVTERRQAEVALLQSEARFRGLFESAAIGIGLTGADGRLIEVNPTLEAFLGYSSGEMLAQNFPNITHPDDRTSDSQLTQEVIDGVRDFFQLEKRYIHKNGQVFWGRVTVSAVRNSGGEFQFTVAILEDITERKKAEERLRLLESVVVNANDAVIIAEAAPITLPGPRIIYVNEAFTRMTGYSREEAIGKTPRMLQGPKTDLTELRKIRHALETWQSVRVELINYRKDGSDFWVELEIVPVADESGWFTHWISVQRDITERKLAEERLRLLERAIAASNNGIIITDAQTPDNPIIYVNSGFERLTGYRPEDVIGSECCPFDRTYATPSILKQLRRAIDEGKETQVTLRSSRIDGTSFWSDFCITPVRDNRGRLTNFIGVQTDITRRKLAEEALRNSEERLQLALEASAMGLWDWKINTGQIYFNPQWKTMLGYEVEEISNSFLSWEQLVHPEDLPRVIESINTHLEERSPIYETEYRMLSKSGEWKWILSQGKVMERDVANKPVRMTGTNIDISDRKQAEIELAAAKAALERRIQRELLLGRITQDIRSTLQPTQIFDTAATQIGQAFAVSRCIIHTYIAEPIPRIPQVAEYLELGYPSMMQQEIPVLGNRHAERVLSQDQAVASNDVYQDPLLAGMADIMQQLSLKSTLVVRTSYHGKPNGIVCLEQCDLFRHWTIEEIELLEAVAAQMGIAIAQANLLEQETQRRQELAAQNHALEKAKLAAESANRAKSQFLSKMSHELRTPLNAILGFTQVMARNAALTSEQAEHLQIINHSGEHLLGLINDILSMSKIEAGQVTLNKNRFDLYRLLDSLEEMLRLKASAKNLQLIFQRTTDLPQYAFADESKLRQVLINLLENAIKFTQIGRVTLRVSLVISHWSLVKDKEQRTNDKGQLTIQFEVEDTGPGIAPVELNTLFDPFVQTQTGRQSMEGTGLGLPISQQFVRLMGGELTVSSQLGKGSIFTFDIQVEKATAADAKSISSQRRVIGLDPNQPNYRLLIVEDAAVNRLLLVEMLQPLGFEVRTAANGQEAIAVWESWSPHLILMDILMPVMGGDEATQQIKRTPRGSDTVIIALTARAFEEQREALFRAGCDDFIPKPFREELLLEKLAHHLGVRYLYEEQQPAISPPSPACVEPLTPEALAVMPTSWVTQLHQAALYADDELMNQLVEQIPLEHECLRRALITLIDNFYLEQLIDLTELAGS